jgi:DnaD/phage-associated family protein
LPNSSETVQQPQNKIGELIKIYEDNIGIATPMVLEELTYIADTYPDGWFADAVRESVIYKKQNIAYIKKILSTWESEGRNNGQRKEKVKDADW